MAIITVLSSLSIVDQKKDFFGYTQRTAILTVTLCLIPRQPSELCSVKSIFMDENMVATGPGEEIFEAEYGCHALLGTSGAGVHGLLSPGSG